MNSTLLVAPMFSISDNNFRQPPRRYLGSGFGWVDGATTEVRAEATTIALMDAPNYRMTVERIMCERSLPVCSDTDLDLTCLLDLGQLTRSLQQRLRFVRPSWLDLNHSNFCRPEWRYADRLGWQIKVTGQAVDPHGQEEVVRYITDCFRSATVDAGSGLKVTICLLSHSDRYAEAAEDFCRAGGKLLLIGYIGYFERRLYELSHNLADTLDVEYDCGAGIVAIREIESRNQAVYHDRLSIPVHEEN